MPFLYDLPNAINKTVNTSFHLTFDTINTTKPYGCREKENGSAHVGSNQIEEEVANKAFLFSF